MDSKNTEYKNIYIPNEPPFGDLGYITFKRTYARRLNDDDKNSNTEEWEDTINRVVKACNEQLKCGFTQFELYRLFHYLYNLKCCVAGRFLWQLGTNNIEKMGLLSLQNCAFIIVDEPIRPFVWTMNMLMVGAGVGYNIQKKHISKLPLIKKVKIERLDTKDADFIVPDSREGWCKLLKRTLKAHFITGDSFTYSCICLRSKGALIKTFGGIASGPDILCEGIDLINKLLNSKFGKFLNSIDVLDIMNILGMIVVSGNVRRSAQIAIGDYDDIEFLKAKRFDISPSPPNWRCYSNNSVVCSDITKLPMEFWETYEKGGEPYGLINLDLAKKCGRIGEFEYTDYGVEGFNPCSEQSLENNETCCLAEIYLPNILTYDELIECSTFLYRIAKHSLALPCNVKETEKVVHKNMRMGIGITGYLQAKENQRRWLPKLYQTLRKFDEYYSSQFNFPTSIKLTTCKPSGTLSLLAGVTSGVHPAYSQYMIRRIRISSNSNLIEVCKNHGYDVEYQINLDGSLDYTTCVVSFPYSYPEGTVLTKDCTAITQLEYVKRLQKEWSDNSVSCTIYYKKEELDDIKIWLKENYKDNIKSLSFLLHSEHGFIQAPLEEITKEEYFKMKHKVKKFHRLNNIKDNTNLDINLDTDCEKGMCPIK